MHRIDEFKHNLKKSQSFRRYALIVLMSFFGFLVLSFGFFQDVTEKLEQTSRQSEGLAALVPTKGLSEEIALVHLDLLQGKKRFRKSEQKIRALFSNLAASEKNVEKYNGTVPLSLRKKMGQGSSYEILSHWNEVASGKSSNVNEDMLDMQRELRNLSEMFADSSGLINDQNLYLSYLSNIAWIRMPEWLDLTMQLLVMTAEQSEDSQLDMMAAYVRSDLEGIRWVIQKMFVLDDPSVPIRKNAEHLDIAYQSFFSISGGFVNHLEEALARKKERFPSQDLLLEGNRALKAGFAFWDLVNSEVKKAHHIREKKIRFNKLLFLGIGIGILLFSLYLSVRFSRV